MWYNGMRFIRHDGVWDFCVAVAANITEKRKRQKNDYCNSSSSSCLKEKFGEEEMAAVKEVIGHVFGSEVIRELLPLSAGEGDVDAVD
eukprot:scaffold82658_cov40-Cyclotella_meneghiniana.AAC.2